jgi:hypothetical protein
MVAFEVRRIGMKKAIVSVGLFSAFAFATAAPTTSFANSHLSKITWEKCMSDDQPSYQTKPGTKAREQRCQARKAQGGIN